MILKLLCAYAFICILFIHCKTTERVSYIQEGTYDMCIDYKDGRKESIVYQQDCPIAPRLMKGDVWVYFLKEDGIYAYVVAEDVTGFFLIKRDKTQ